MKFNLNILKDMIEKDLSWNMIVCDQVCLKIPSIKAKYCGILYEIEISVKAKELKLQQMYKKLHEYYLSGQGSDVLIDRRDLDIYIKGDERYIPVMASYELEKSNAKYIEGVLKAIDSMSFSINAAVKWNMYTNGE